MNLAIMGSTGFIGGTLVDKALEAGHQLRVLARDPAKLGEVRSRVEVVQGALSDQEALARLVAGVDAVLSAAGPTNEADQPELFERSMRSLVEAMEREQVDRLVMISGGGSLIIPGEPVSLRRRLMNLAMRLKSARRIQAKEREFAVLAQSSLRWTSVRPPIVRDDAPTGNVVAAADDLPGLRIAVEDLAQFMLAQLEDDTWVRRAPFVASRP